MLIRLLLLLALLLPSVSHAANLFTEDFESSLAILQAKYSCSYSSPAPFTDGAAQDWDTAQKFAGTYAMKQTYSGSQYDNPPRGGGSCEYDFADQTQRDIWITWYHRLGTNWQSAGGGGVGGTATKGLYMYMKSLSTGQVNGWVFHYFYGGNQLTLSAQGIKDHKGPNGPGTGTAIPYDTENMWQNVSSFEQPEGQWVCYEANFKLNTPGLADGQYLLYSTNMSTGGSTVLRASHTNREFIDSTTAGRMPSDARWFRFKYYRQDGSGDMWYDNSYVDTTRRGCSGTPPPSDTTPPAQVTGLTAVSNTSDSITYSWTANTEVDLQQYVIQGCTGAACTNFGTVGNRVTNSFTWTGRAASTLYRLKVAAQDSSGNVGTFSSIVDDTTDAATTLPTVTAFTTTATGGQITYTLTPTDFRIEFGGTNGDGTFWSSQIIRTLAQVPGGALSFNWPAGTNYACVHARDAVAAEDPIAYVCNSVTPGAPGGTPSGTYLRKLSSNPRWLTLDGSTAIYRVGISGGDNCNASFCGLQDVNRGDYTNLTTSALYSDTFDGTGALDTAIWLDGYTGQAAMTRASGVLNASAPSTNGFVSLNRSMEESQYATFTIAASAGAGAIYQGIGLRFADSPTLSGIECTAMRNTSKDWNIGYYAAGAWTELASGTGVTWAANDVGYCEVVGDTVTFKRNGTTLGTGTYTARRTGKVAAFVYAATLADAGLTAFTGGNIVADYTTNLNTLVTEGSNWVRYWILEQSHMGSDAQFAANTDFRFPLTQFP